MDQGFIMHTEHEENPGHPRRPFALNGTTERLWVTFSLILILVAVLGCQSLAKPSTNRTSQRSTQTTPIAPRLLRPLEFVDFTVSDIRSPDGIKTLRAQKLSLGGNDPGPHSILATNIDAPRIQIETVNQYKAAIHSGYAAQNNCEMMLVSFFEIASATLDFMEKARPSTASYLGTLKQLPVSILNWVGSEEEEQLKRDTTKGITLQDYAKPSSQWRLHNLKAVGNAVSFSSENEDYVVNELCRGDFDHDGLEDSLIVVYWHYKEGSGFNLEYHLVSRTDPKQKALKVVRFKL